MHNVFINIEAIRQPGTILGVGYKWRGSKRAEWVRGDDMIPAVRELLDACDVAVGYNSNAFDLKHLKREILLADLTPPSPFKSIDLYSVVRKNFKFQSNKLAFVVDQLGIGQKASAGGYSTWQGCMAGDEKSWALMARYCKQDVRVTEALLERLMPWITNWPNAGLYNDSDRPACSRCGGTHLVKQGLQHAIAQSYQRFQCQDCGSWSRGLAIERRAQGETRAI